MIKDILNIIDEIKASAYNNGPVSRNYTCIK